MLLKEGWRDTLATLVACIALFFIPTFVGASLLGAVVCC